MVSVQSMVLGLSAATATLASASSLSSLSSYDLPTFDYPSLNSGDVPQRLLNAITTDGIVALKNVPNYANLRERYLREAAQCAAIKGDDQFVSRKLFADGTKRMTISTNAGRELRGSAQETEAACPGFRELYEEFSQTIEHAVNSFGAALDQTSFKASDGQTEISSRRLVSEAVRLDHFHAYEAADAIADASTLHSQRLLEELSLPLHEDHGLFIAMSAPKYFEVESDGRRLVERKLAADASGLVIQTSSGERVRPVLNGDELVLMMGTGASRWLQTSHAVPAVLHGMKMPEPLNGRRSLRAWFGKMTLLPAYQRMLETSSPFEAHVNATTRQLLVNEESDLKSVGCASDRRLAPSDEKCTLKQCSTKAGATAPEETCAVVCNRKGHSATDATECAAKCTCTDIAGPANICWMLCVANLPSCPVDSQTCSGQSIVCPTSTTPSTTAPPSSPTSAPGSENGTPAPGTPTKAPGSPTSAPGTTPAPGAAGTTPAASTPTVNGSRSGSASSGETTPADKQGEDSVTKPAATTAVPKATPKSSAAAMAISSIACAGVAFASVVLL